MNALWLCVLGATPSGTATVPLEELVALLDPKANVASAKPVAAVTSLSLSGRPNEVGLWVDVEATVRVISAGPAPVPLLRVGADAVVEALPDGAEALVTVDDGRVTAVCSGAGAHRLAFRLLLRAARDGRRATARFHVAAGVPPTPLKLEVDDGVFEVLGASVVREWGGYVVFPARGAYEVSWAARRELASRPQVAQRAPVDPQVKEATSRWVTTLEGRATHEVKLVLQLDRPDALTLQLPAGQQVVRARVNGVPLPVATLTSVVVVEVTPTSLGATEAVVELALAKDLGVFHLSGQLELEAPRVSWPVARWTTEAVLPKVFTWARRGGSMEQLGVEAEARGDVPGKALFFTQHLIAASAPSVSLGYSVDLRGSYFR
ncbi:MAG: hypothetical protein IAE78_09035 [Myxococcus sp.]|nr:hypothetical protein [Myxococcus sp.]